LLPSRERRRGERDVDGERMCGLCGHCGRRPRSRRHGRCRRRCDFMPGLVWVDHPWWEPDAARWFLEPDAARPFLGLRMGAPMLLLGERVRLFQQRMARRTELPDAAAAICA